MVAPSPPSPRSPGRHSRTRGCAPRAPLTASRIAPDPCPWMTVTRPASARAASSRYCSSSASASSTRAPRRSRLAATARGRARPTPTPRQGRGPGRSSCRLPELPPSPAARRAPRPAGAHQGRPARRGRLQLVEGHLEAHAADVQRGPPRGPRPAPRACPASRSRWRRADPPASGRGRAGDGLARRLHAGHDRQARVDARHGLVQARFGERLACQRAAHLRDLGLDRRQGDLRLSARLGRGHASLGAGPPALVLGLGQRLHGRAARPRPCAPPLP